MENSSVKPYRILGEKNRGGEKFKGEKKCWGKIHERKKVQGEKNTSEKKGEGTRSRGIS